MWRSGVPVRALRRGSGNLGCAVEGRGGRPAWEPSFGRAEEPPGLDRVRRWLAPVGRVLRGVWLWVRWLAVRFYALCRWIGWFAARSARVARVTAAVADRVGSFGARLEGTGRDWSRAEGRLGRFGERMARRGGRFREGGSHLADLLRSAAGIGEAIGEPEAATGRREEEGGERIGLGIGRPRLPRPPEPAPAREGGAAEQPPSSRPPERHRSPAEPASAMAPASSAAPASPTEPASSAAPASPTEPASSAGPASPASPASLAEPAAPALPPSVTVGGGSAPADALPAPTAEADQIAPDSPPGVREAPPPSAAGRSPLPDDFPIQVRAEVESLGKRPRKDDLRRVILLVCAIREWTTPAELADWLGASLRNLSTRHLGPMTEEGLLERRYPNRIQRRDQAYRAARPRSDRTAT